MIKKVGSLWDFIKKWKYIAILVLFTLWVSFFDRASLVYKSELKKDLNNLKQEKKKYLKDIKENSTTLKGLHDDDILEKYARENYNMKKDNEDLYIFVEEEPDEE